ncbi:MAG: 5-aminolevulinate synthase [Defluviimonas sp.]|nr:5-aminolevulinate synthase [Paracoccaceae bacterium]MCC0065099.1 5-aminolevulinate synthase [Defluviimonas sp.]
MHSAVAYIVLAALAYAGATLGIKTLAVGGSTIAVGFIAAAFLVATLAEVQLLRQAPLAMVYMIVLSIETCIVLVCAMMLGEGLSPRQMAGAACVLCGIALVGF